MDLCPVDIQCHLSDSWSSSSVNSQVIMTAENLVEQQTPLWSPSHDPGTAASMKVFTSVMLHAWRQRRADVRRLQKVVERLQRKTMHSNNKLHVSNTLMRVEKKRCVELQVELTKSTLSISQIRSSCEKLTESVESLKADKKQMEHELHNCKGECVELKRRANKTRDDLLNALLEQHRLQDQLSEEQTKVQQLTRDNEQLLSEVMKLRSLESNSTRSEESYALELEQKDEALYKMRSTIESLDHKLKTRNIKRSEFNQLVKSIKIRQNEDCKQGQNKLPQGSNLQAQPEKGEQGALAHMAEEYGLREIFNTIHYYTSSAALILWLVLLPNKSVRYGCMPSKNRNKRV